MLRKSVLNVLELAHARVATYFDVHYIYNIYNSQDAPDTEATPFLLPQSSLQSWLKLSAASDHWRTNWPYVPSQDEGHQIWSQTELNLPKPTLNMIKAAQLRLHKERVLAIEGDDESEATSLNP